MLSGKLGDTLPELIWRHERGVDWDDINVRQKLKFLGYESLGLKE